MTDLPRRPRAHRLDHEGQTAFDAALPQHLVATHTHQPEYGIDGEVEVFDPQAYTPTGIRFYFQLKSTDQPHLNDARKVRLRTATANYMRLLPLPVLIVLYHSPTQSLYARWFHHYDPYYESTSAGRVETTTLTFHIHGDDLLSEPSASRLPQQAKAWLDLRSGRVPEPMPVYVTSYHPSIRSSEFARAITRALRGLPGLITVASGPADSPHSAIQVHPDALTVSILDTTSLTLHQDLGLEDQSQLGYEACCAIAMALLHANAEAPSVRLAMHVASRSRLLLHPDFALYLASALRHSRRYADALSLASEIAARDDDESYLAQLVLLAVMDQVPLLNGIELGQVREVFGQLLDRATQQEDHERKAALSYSLGKTLMTAGRYNEAFPYLNCARKLDHTYADRPYYWRDLGGCLVLMGRPIAGVLAYHAAASLSPEDTVLGSRLADALFLGGRLDEAYRRWDAVLSANPEVDGHHEWRLKMDFVNMLRQRCGFPARVPPATTEPSDQDAVLSTGNPQEVAEHLRRLTHHYPLHNGSWFNLGIASYELGDPEAAYECFKAAAILARGDAEAWVNAVLLALDMSARTESEDNALDEYGTLLAAGCAALGSDFTDELERQLELNDVPSETQEEILSAAESLVAEASPTDPGSIIRLPDEGGALSEVEVGSLIG